MAIDTAAKRASVQAYALGLMRPPPDGTVNEGDRACLAWLYQGMDYDSPTPTGKGHRWFMWFWDFLLGFEEFL
ncbi:hypothetical protein KAR91_36315 [Candidatus Pacearchaeota archaeon]|nr:hypothetical protein [Candidatus Pacearchaeota archaeon]